MKTTSSPSIYSVLIENQGIRNCLLNEMELRDVTFIKKQPATLCEKFDYCLKKQYEKGKCYLPAQTVTNIEDSFGLYIPRYGRIYDRYFSKGIRQHILQILSKDILEDFISGDGNEISTKKYFSVASSSRFATASFSEFCDGYIQKIKTFNGQKVDFLQFEKDCPIDDISMAHLDVYFTTNNTETYYIEAKCHEIFSNHTKVELDTKYLRSEKFNEILRLLQLDRNVFNGNGEFIANSESHYLTAQDFGIKVVIRHFDFKKFLCHLMGQMTTQKKVPYNFYYLFYKATGPDFTEIYEELECEIKAVREAFKPVFKQYNINFGYLFNSVFDTLNEVDVL